MRIAAVAHPQAELKPIARLKTGGFPGLAECVEQALAGHSDLRPRSMLACGAGPVAHRRLHLTNARWTIDGPGMAERLGLVQGLLLNDFEAQALALPAHRGEWLHRIGPSFPAEPGPQVILGPGTGLGVAALILSDGRFLPLASEAAHMELGPSTPEDAAIWPHLDLFHGRMTAEAVLSGPGLVRLHKARQIAAGVPYDGLDGIGIVTRGLAHTESAEAETIRHFWTIAGRFAGNMALTFLAHGGVTLAGGILPRMLDLLDEKAFRTAFEDKAPLQGVVQCIETRLLIAPDAVLAGMAAIAARPDRYMIDYAARAWR